MTLTRLQVLHRAASIITRPRWPRPPAPKVPTFQVGDHAWWPSDAYPYPECLYHVTLDPGTDGARQTFYTGALYPPFLGLDDRVDRVAEWCERTASELDCQSLQMLAKQRESAQWLEAETQVLELLGHRLPTESYRMLAPAAYRAIIMMRTAANQCATKWLVELARRLDRRPDLLPPGCSARVGWLGKRAGYLSIRIASIFTLEFTFSDYAGISSLVISGTEEESVPATIQEACLWLAVRDGAASPDQALRLCRQLDCVIKLLKGEP